LQQLLHDTELMWRC